VAPLSSSAISDRKLPAHRLILPLGMRVLVQVIRIEERTDAGLYLPAGAKEAQDEAFYGKADPKAVETAWPYLGHHDRFLRYRGTAESKNPFGYGSTVGRSSRTPTPQTSVPG
jgi:hypothetical protein